MKAAMAGVVAVVGLLVGLSIAPAAQARVRCSHSGAPTNVLTVRATKDALGVVRRRGDEILVREFLDRPEPCSGGTPTVLNTDTIKIVTDFFSTVDLNLRDGPFAPGATAEPDGAPEIEVEFRFRGLAGFGGATGTAGDDELEWVSGGAHPALNLNPGGGDHDADVTMAGGYPVMMASGAEGNDKITPAPDAHIPEFIFSKGGRGNDFLVAPAVGSILEGGPGEDKLIGSRAHDDLAGGRGKDRVIGAGGLDWLNGGRGRDLLVGGPGRDRINAVDSRRDLVRCGAGRDHVRADPQDRLHGCEVISH